MILSRDAIRTLNEWDGEKPPQNEKARQVRAWFERLPKMRAQIEQQQAHIEVLKGVSTSTTSSISAAPGRSGTSDKVGNGSLSIIEAEDRLAALKCQYVEMQKAAIDAAFLLNADSASINRSKCLILCYVEGKTREQAAEEVGYAQGSTVTRAIRGAFAALAEIWDDTRFGQAAETAP